MSQTCRSSWCDIVPADARVCGVTELPGPATSLVRSQTTLWLLILLVLPRKGTWEVRAHWVGFSFPRGGTLRQHLPVRALWSSFLRRPPLQEGQRALGINRSNPLCPPTTVSWRESLSSLYSENLGPLLEVKPTTATGLPGVGPKGALPISHTCLRCVQQLLIPFLCSCRLPARAASAPVSRDALCLPAPASRSGCHSPHDPSSLMNLSRFVVFVAIVRL